MGDEPEPYMCTWVVLVFSVLTLPTATEERREADGSLRLASVNVEAVGCASSASGMASLL